MNAVPETFPRGLEQVPPGAAAHFRLALLGSVAQIIEGCSGGDLDVAFRVHPFLAEYHEELSKWLGAGDSVAPRWRSALKEWEEASTQPMPLRNLASMGLGTLDLELLLAVGLIEEDPRFGVLFAHPPLQESRPLAGQLMAWWRMDEAGEDRIDAVRHSLLGLIRAGLVEVADSTAPRPDWVLNVPAVVWDALRGEAPELPWLKYVAHEDLLPLESYVGSPEVLGVARELPDALSAQPHQLVVLRGPRYNGRKTLIGCVARSMGKALLIASEAACDDERRWRLFTTLPLLLGALPVLDLELLSGSSRTLPPMPTAQTPLFVVTGTAGAVSVADSRPVVSIGMPLPIARYRHEHWCATLSESAREELAGVTQAMRLTSGNIRRSARTAASIARLAGARAIQRSHLRQACRSLQADRLETLATRIETEGSLADLALDESTRRELDALLARCRHREALADEGPSFTRGSVGVRALLAGPSGTGKTLAARLLAASLGKDLYRVDLAATINKYLGETEKNLDRALTAAEELDVVLLLDEGDAVLAARTDLFSSNDRHANLETNFMLQRVDSFTGILLVTSNAPDRIDKAFRRRMDAIVRFRAPDEWRRYEILNLHLPVHAVSDALLQEIAYRCALTGGQLRNVAEHARLLALQAARSIGEEELCEALQREYGKTGSSCPLKRPAPGPG